MKPTTFNDWTEISLTDDIVKALPSQDDVDELHFMLDIETLGKEKDGFAPIVSLSLIPFTKDKIFKECAIFTRMDMDAYDNLPIKSQISTSTIIWWMKQSEDARQEFLGGKSDLLATLRYVSDYIKFAKTLYGNSKVKMWAKSHDFDVVLCERWLRGLSNDYNAEIIPYNMARCVRTSTDDAIMKAKDKLKFYNDFPTGEKLTLHNPFVDNILQIEQIQYGWNYSD